MVSQRAMIRWIYSISTSNTIQWSVASFHHSLAILSKWKARRHLAPTIPLSALKRRVSDSSYSNKITVISFRIIKWWPSPRIATSYATRHIAKMVTWWAWGRSRATRGIWRGRLTSSTSNLRRRIMRGNVLEVVKTGRTSSPSQAVQSWEAWSGVDWSSTRGLRQASSEVMDLIREGQDLLLKIARAKTCLIRRQSWQ